MSDVKPIDHGTLIDWVNEYDHATEDSRETSEKCRDYYDSKQLSDKEVRALKKRKQAPVVVNRIKPKMDGLMGMERANKTTAKAYGRTPKHEKAANAASEAIRYVLQDNFYDQRRSAAWENLLIEGTGGIEVIVKDAGDEVKIVINHIPWDRLIYDPHARRKDFSDARFRGQFVWMDYDQALEQYPDGADVLEELMAGSSTFDDKPRWVDGTRKRVRIVELYYQWQGDIWYSCFTRGGSLKGPEKAVYVNEEGDTEDPYEFASLFVDREGNRYGATLQLLDVQDEINKRRSKALHLMSVRQVRWERGAVEDINKAREELAKPDGVVETTPGMEFEVLKTGDMAQAQFKLLEESKLEIDAVSYNAAASGKDQRMMSGIALRNREAAAQTELAPMFDVLKHLDVRVYRKVWNRVKQYWKSEKWIRITDNQEDLRWVGLNKPVTKGEMLLRQAQEQGAPPEQLQALQQQIASDPMSQEVVSTENDVAELDVDIVIDDAPDSVTMQQEEFQALSEMVKSGIPIPATAIVASSNLKDKDKILQEMRNSPALPPQVEEQMKKLQDEAQKLAQENQQLKADQQTEVAKLQVKTQAEQQELAMKASYQAEELRLERERMEAEAQLARDKAAAEIAVKRMVAEADLAIERERLALDKERMEFERQQAEQQQAHDQKMAEKTAAAKAKQPAAAGR